MPSYGSSLPRLPVVQILGLREEEDEQAHRDWGRMSFILYHCLGLAFLFCTEKTYHCLPTNMSQVLLVYQIRSWCHSAAYVSFRFRFVAIRTVHPFSFLHHCTVLMRYGGALPHVAFYRLRCVARTPFSHRILHFHRAIHGCRSILRILRCIFRASAFSV